MSNTDDLRLPTDPGLEVYATERGFVAISQESPMENDQVIIISPERVDRLIQFLRIVKDQILTERADDAASSEESPPLLNG